jgi:DNA replication protein DnaC
LSACQKGYSVAFTTAAALVHELMEARDERRLRALQKHLNTVKLLIVDELGYVPFMAVGSELLFEVFSQRYERGNGHPYSVRNGSLAHCSTALPIMSTFWR